MNAEERTQLRAQAARQFDEHLARNDGERVATSLCAGLDLLRDVFFARICSDVENQFGRDTLLSPVSAVESELATKRETECFLTAEASVCLQEAGYVQADRDWLLHWLGGLRLGTAMMAEATTSRLTLYLSKNHDERRRAFSVLIEKRLPEAHRAPLIVYRLLPLAVLIAGAVAFGDYPRALAARKRQMAILPEIQDCHTCNGGVLENGDKCKRCGNPLWNYEWLTAE